MAERTTKETTKKKPIESYDHKDKRKTYEYDPRLDPQLVWAGKAEPTSFELSTNSLHVHERIAPRSIITATLMSNTRVTYNG